MVRDALREKRLEEREGQERRGDEGQIDPEPSSEPSRKAKRGDRAVMRSVSSEALMSLSRMQSPGNREKAEIRGGIEER